MNPSDVAVIAVTFASVAQTAALLLGLRTVARQLRIAAPPKEAPSASTVPPGGTP